MFGIMILCKCTPSGVEDVKNRRGGTVSSTVEWQRT